MAKDRLGLKDTLGLSPKVKVKKTEVDIDKTEKAVKQIHSENNGLTRITVDMDKALHKLVKRKLLDDELTLRDYILKLIKQDLKL